MGDKDISWRQKTAYLAGAALALTLNQTVPYISAFYHGQAEPSIDTSKDVRATEPLPSDFSVEDYLNTANAIVHEKKTAEADCLEMSLATYETYHNLIRKNHRDDLEHTVRISLGWSRGSGVGHLWLEYLEDGTYKTYEAMEKTPKLPPTFTQMYSEATDKRIADDLMPIAASNPGDRTLYPVSARPLLFFGGGIRMLIESSDYLRRERLIDEEIRKQQRIFATLL